MIDKLKRNWKTVKEEFVDYQLAIAIAMSKVHRAKGLIRKLHHLSGLGPDLNRYMPRTVWYAGVLAAALVTLTVIWWFA